SKSISARASGRRSLKTSPLAPVYTGIPSKKKLRSLRLRTPRQRRLFALAKEIAVRTAHGLKTSEHEFHLLLGGALVGAAIAARHYDGRGKFRAFANYRILWLAQAAVRFERSGVIRISERIPEEIKKLEAAWWQATHKLGRQASAKEAFAESDLALKTVQRIRAAEPLLETIPLQTGVADNIPQDTFPSPFDAYDEKVTRRRLARVMRRLKPAQAEIIRLRYSEGMTQEEAGNTLGLSRWAVQRRECQILETLNDTMHRLTKQEGFAYLYPNRVPNRGN
ncbi:sigma-70 family RNA polymerase sigma factor, partial [Candidatus Margulisiibacteriota bacterium]